MKINNNLKLLKDPSFNKKNWPNSIVIMHNIFECSAIVDQSWQFLALPNANMGRKLLQTKPC